jgi:hypothetical protein
MIKFEIHGCLAHRRLTADTPKYLVQNRLEVEHADVDWIVLSFVLSALCYTLAWVLLYMVMERVGSIKGRKVLD